MVKVAIGCLVALVLATYGGIWSMGWVYDDPNWLPLALDGAAWPQWGRAPLALMTVVGGGLPWAYHGLLLLLHLLNGALVWSLSRAWLSDVGAVLTLTLFWLHPLQVDSVAYVSGGVEVLLLTYLLVGVLGLRSRSWWLRGLGFSACALAVTLKWSALPLLLAVPLLVPACRRWLMVVAGVALVVVAVPAVQHYIARPAAWLDRWDALAAWGVGLVGLIGRVGWPRDLAVFHDWRASAPDAVAALVLIAGVGVLAWRCRPTMPALWWAWCAVVGLTAPRALVPLAPALTEHHTYVPFLAIWILAGASTDRLLTRMAHA